MQEIPGLSLTGHQYLWLYFSAGGLALLFSWFLTPLVRLLALDLKIIDKPDRRKIHPGVVARWGGMAIFASFFLTLIVLWLFSSKFRNLMSFQHYWMAKETLGIFLGGLGVFIVGLMDDVRPMPPKVKLLSLMAAGFFLVLFGLKVTGFTNPLNGIFIHMGPAGSIFLTLFWVLALANVFNFIDGLDGLAAGVAFIAAASFFVVSVVLKTGIAQSASMGHLTYTAILSCVLCGTTLGFLRYNYYPAKIFMGDSGSLFLGYILSVLALMGTFKTTAAMAVFIPFFEVAIPLLDAFWVIMNRLFRGQPMSMADKTHIHHRLLAKGLTQPQAVWRVYSAAILFAVVGIVLAVIKK